MLQDRIDQNVKGYELREQIGEGGYGAVYRAYQPLVGRDVAVKIILPQYANHPDFIRRFEWEAQLVARLEHPYIVPLYDYWRDPDGAFLVMRWLRGGNLHDLLHNQPLPSELLGRLIEQIGGALASAHRRGVVHRDLKPANVLLDEEGNAYLADFGIAKDMGTRASPYQTDASTVVGSPAYISPEQVRAEPITTQT
jgi:serine/threonine protein kinase